MKPSIILGVALGLAACSPRSGVAGPTRPVSEATQTLSEGDRAPEFMLVDNRGEDVSLAGITQSGPAVIVFYRGHW